MNKISIIALSLALATPVFAQNRGQSANKRIAGHIAIQSPSGSAGRTSARGEVSTTTVTIPNGRYFKTDVSTLLADRTYGFNEILNEAGMEIMNRYSAADEQWKRGLILSSYKSFDSNSVSTGIIELSCGVTVNVRRMTIKVPEKTRDCAGSAQNDGIAFYSGAKADAKGNIVAMPTFVSGLRFSYEGSDGGSQLVSVPVSALYNVFQDCKASTGNNGNADTAMGLAIASTALSGTSAILSGISTFSEINKAKTAKAATAVYSTEEAEADAKKLIGAFDAFVDTRIRQIYYWTEQAFLWNFTTRFAADKGGDDAVVSPDVPGTGAAPQAMAENSVPTLDSENVASAEVPEPKLNSDLKIASDEPATPAAATAPAAQPATPAAAPTAPAAKKKNDKKSGAATPAATKESDPGMGPERLERWRQDIKDFIRDVQDMANQNLGTNCAKISEIKYDESAITITMGGKTDVDIPRARAYVENLQRKFKYEFAQCTGTKYKTGSSLNVKDDHVGSAWLNGGAALTSVGSTVTSAINIATANKVKNDLESERSNQERCANSVKVLQRSVEVHNSGIVMYPTK